MPTREEFHVQLAKAKKSLEPLFTAMLVAEAAWITALQQLRLPSGFYPPSTIIPVVPERSYTLIDLQTLASVYLQAKDAYHSARLTVESLARTLESSSSLEAR
jgi:hypothetical protein